MFQMPSLPPPIPSRGGGCEGLTMDRLPASKAINSLSRELAPAIAEAAALVSDYGAFGLVWLDQDLIVTRRYGSLVDFISMGKPVTASLMELIGLEDEIKSLATLGGRILELPAVGIVMSGTETKRLNFSIFWQPGQKAFLVLIYRVASQTELELELSRQIRARLMAEAVVTAKSKELSRANADLEAFAGIISHDLKAPLRHLRRLTQDLAARAQDAGDLPLHTKLKDIEAQSARMSGMLTALLDYSSLGRKYEATVDVDTRTLVDSIVQSLPASGAAITISGTWPTLPTPVAPLDLILRNLIDNALKHHDRGGGQVEISCADGPQALTISVADDGPGIDPKHHQAAFLPFRTLAAPAISHGTGMGLALVKRAAETAGGSVTLASDPASRRGTVFTLTWPKYIMT
jgi:signal transduction histidine kinase